MRERIKLIKDRAMQAIRANRLVDARALATEACDLNRSDVEAWTLLAATNAQLGRLDDVIACCHKIIDLQPDNAAAHFNLGVAYQNLGKLAPAEDGYRRALQLQPQNMPALLNLGLVLLSERRPAEAAAIFAEALRIDPDQAHAHNGYGLALKAQDRLDEAIAGFRRAVQLAPESADIHCNLGVALVAKGDIAQAGECFNAALRLRPDHVDAAIELSKIEITRNNHRDAESILHRAIAMRPGSPGAHFQLGHTHYVQEHYPQALESYLRVLAIEPQNVAAINNIGRIYERTGNFDDAVRHYRLALTHGETGQLHCNIGRTFMAQRNWQAAAEEYRRAIAVQPDEPTGHMGLAQACCEMNRTEEAKACLQRALELDPGMGIAKYLLASLEGETPSNEAVSDYVTGLFDDYADKFDRHLVNELQYRTPELLNQHIRLALAGTAPLDIMDLGCGTGLCGPLLRDMAARLEGVDLSPKMIEKARARGVYDELHVGELTAVVNASTRQYDLFVAADVFVYIGDLSAIFAACADRLRPGGLFAFSVESLHDATGFQPRGSGRLAHSAPYIEDLARRYRFEPVEQSECQLRLEHRLPIAGTIYVLRRI